MAAPASAMFTQWANGYATGITAVATAYLAGFLPAPNFGSSPASNRRIFS